jgi:hypothetical protein
MRIGGKGFAGHAVRGYIEQGRMERRAAQSWAAQVTPSEGFTDTCKGLWNSDESVTKPASTRVEAALAAVPTYLTSAITDADL